ncbi:MAG: tetratricopeptide repeat protein [Acidihalobacter sp.]
MKAGVERLGGQAGEQRRWGRAVRGGGLVGVSLCGMLLLGGCASLTGAGGTTLREDAPKVSTSKIHLTARNRAIYDVLAGELAGQAGDPKQALAYYLKALHEAPEPELARRVIDIATYLGENDTALEAARRWVELEANSVDAQRAAGVIEARAGHPLRATAHLRRFVVLSGKPYGNSLVLCGALLSQGVDREVALQTMRALASDFPREAYAHYALGTLALHLDDNAQALASADRALKLKPNFKEALILKAQAQMGMNQPHRALRTLQDALGKDRGDVGLQLAYARLLVQLKRYDAAREQFRALLKHHPDNANVLYTLGLLDYQLGRDAEARRRARRRHVHGDAALRQR